MSRVVYGASEFIAAWVAERIAHVGKDGFGPCAALGVASRDGTRLLAGVVYHDYQPKHETIQASMASVSPMWARLEIITELLAYPFFQLGVFKVWSAIPIDSEKTINTNRHLGFTQEGILAHQFGRGRHAVITRLLRPDFNRIYGVSNGQIIPFGPRRA